MPNELSDDRATRLAAANINPVTGLATDYLNHFNEAIMLLEALSSCPECLDDLRAWKPASYREHFAQSRFKHRALAIEAYDAADPAVKQCLDTLADTMTSVLEATRAALSAELPAETAAQLAQRAVAWLRPLVARAGAVINGDAQSTAAPTPQAAADILMRR
jgi:hypothetical protein